MNKICMDYSREFMRKLQKKGYLYSLQDFNYGKKKIVIPNYNEPILKDLNIFQSKTKSTSYRGSPFFSMVTLLYIEQKFPNTCVIIPDKTNGHLKHEDLSIRYNEILGRVVIPERFWEMFYNCSRKRYVVFPFGYSCKNSGGHANIMIYDRLNKSLERFEPYGSLDDMITEKNKKCFEVDIDEVLFDLFDKRGLIVEYFPPSNFIPQEGLQKKQENENSMHRTDPEGFCTMWSLFYCDLRLSNPDVEREKLLDYTMESFRRNKKSLTTFIRDYANIVSELAPCLTKNQN